MVARLWGFFYFLFLGVVCGCGWWGDGGGGCCCCVGFCGGCLLLF